MGRHLQFGFGAVIAATDSSPAHAKLELANRLTLAFFDSTLKRDDANWNRILTNQPEGVTIESWGNGHTK
jgi:hypothetical protein